MSDKVITSLTPAQKRIKLQQNARDIFNTAVTRLGFIIEAKSEDELKSKSKELDSRIDQTAMFALAAARRFDKVVIPKIKELIPDETPKEK